MGQYFKSGGWKLRSEILYRETLCSLEWFLDLHTWQGNFLLTFRSSPSSILLLLSLPNTYLSHLIGSLVLCCVTPLTIVEHYCNSTLSLIGKPYYQPFATYLCYFYNTTNDKGYSSHLSENKHYLLTSVHAWLRHLELEKSWVKRFNT